MTFLAPASLHASIQNAIYIVAGIVVVIGFATKSSQRHKLDSIPTFLPSPWLGSWWAGFMFAFNGISIIQEGYEKYKSKPFKVADGTRWLVILSSREHREELARAPAEDFSFLAAVDDRLHTEYTMGRRLEDNPYHVSIVRSQLTRNIGVLYPETRDEIVTACDEVFGLSGNEWKSIHASDSIQKVMFRAMNRSLVGLPLCSDPNWLDINMQYSFGVIKGSMIVEYFPALLSFFGFTTSTKRAVEALGPIINERQKQMDRCGDGWVENPNDFLALLLAEAEGHERTIENLTRRVLVVNLAAVHSGSISFTHALFYLAANPGYIQALREEVEAVVDQEGWSKAALGKMRKIDSFLKESQRLKGNSGEALSRQALRDYTFSDGTFIPKGTMIATPAWGLHHNDEIYEHASTFEPFRFANIREADGEGTKHQFASTSIDYLPFGHGRHACPGRFMVAAVFKSMLAHIVVSYDVKLEEADSLYPPSVYFGTSIMPNPRARVMFRRRVN